MSKTMLRLSRMQETHRGQSEFTTGAVHLRLILGLEIQRP